MKNLRQFMTVLNCGDLEREDQGDFIAIKMRVFGVVGIFMTL